jgi:hypothetical protein
MSRSKGETPRPTPLIRHEPVAHSSHCFKPVDSFIEFSAPSGRGVQGCARFSRRGVPPVSAAFGAVVEVERELDRGAIAERRSS